MRTYDLTPLLRTSVGFDRVSRLMEAAREQSAVSYPPYNIVKHDADRYRISLAVSGFAPEELSIELHENRLTIEGRSDAGTDEPVEYLHRGIAARAFKRTFQLAEHILVLDARIEHGLLHIELQREIPEALKPRRIAIQTGESPALAAK